ncbi:MAG: GAF domain-containing protein [Parafilimonas sp.]|nr:GAF domain-containing protein [Parafilimonas sp.]
MRRYLKQFPEASAKLQDIVALAAQITGVPVAFITLLDKDIQWITVKHGYEVEQMPRHTSFCTHTIQQEDVMVVEDALRDERFSSNPLVINPPSVKYYAGTSLKNAEGQNVGTLCVMDVQTHHLNFSQLESLKVLSRQVTSILELSVSISYLKKSLEEIHERNKALKRIAHVQSHEIRGPLSTVMSVMNLIAEEGYAHKEYFQLLDTAVKNLDKKICGIVEISNTAGVLQ